MAVTQSSYALMVTCITYFCLSEIRNTTAASAACSKDEYQCFNGECVPLTAFCDEQPDCYDKSDETDCYNECFLRDDISGMKYRGERRITSQGLHCDQPCRWDNGTAPQCVTPDGYIGYCHIPICDGIQEQSMEYPLFHKKLRWTLVDLETQQEINSSGGLFVINGSTNAKLVLRSPVVEKHTDFMCVRVDYSLNKSRNVDVKLVDWGPYYDLPNTPTTLDASNMDCIHCVREIDVYADEMFQYQDKLYFAPRRSSTVSYNDVYPQMSLMTSLQTVRLRTMKQGENDKEREICSPTTIQCYASNSCLPGSAQLDSIVQCISNQTSLPVKRTSTSCPSYHTCKHMYVQPSSLLTCVSESEVCDGIPHCPHWDDEVDCPHFCPLECVECDFRRLHCPPSVLHNISTRIPYLDLSGFKISVQSLCSVQRMRLVFLNISSGGLTNVSCLCDTNLFPRLQVLDASNNNISVVYRENYQDNKHLNTLILDQNPIRLIMITVHYGLLSLRNCSIHTIVNFENDGRHHSLMLAFNSIPSWYMHLPKRTFVSCIMTKLDLSYNFIEDISPLDICNRIKDLNLHHNKIKNISNSSFFDIDKELINFTLSANMIDVLYPGFFQRFENLKLLNLSMNRIRDIDVDTFREMSELRLLDVSRNEMNSIPVGIFDDLINLHELHLHNNVISHISQYLFLTTTNLQVLDLSNNKIFIIPKKTFWNLRHLKTLNLRGNDIILTSTMFGGLGVLHHLKVARFSLCCVRPSSVHLINCEADEDFFASCYNLLGSKFLSVSVWILACSGICGNIYLLRLKNSKLLKSRIYQHCIITNFAFIDMLMACYLLVIGFVDVSKRGSYGMFHDSWKLSNICTAAGFFVTTSMIGNNLILIIHSILRLLSTKVQIKHEGYVCIVSTIVILLFSLTLSVVPAISTTKPFYTLTNICFPLHIPRSIVRSENLGYSFGFYMVLTAVTIVTVTLCEVIWFHLNNKQREEKRKAVHFELYSKSFLVYVLSHCIRCIPVFILGLIALMEVFDVDDTYPFIAVFVIPLGAAFHPLIQISLLNSRINSSENKNFCLKSIYPNVIKRIKSNCQDIFLVTEPRISKKCNVCIIYRGESGWMQRVSKVHIINKVIKCSSPTYHGDRCKEKVAVQIHVEELRSNICSIEIS